MELMIFPDVDFVLQRGCVNPANIRRHYGQIAGVTPGVTTEIVCGTALPAPTITLAVTDAAPFPTVPVPRTMVITPLALAVALKAVPVNEVAIDVVIVGAGVPGLVIVASTWADWPQARLTD